jgi:hypothetical protein
MLPNEARQLLDLPQAEHGDEPLQLTARAAADAKGNMTGNKTRDSQRANNQSDGPATISGRNPQGEGRASQ